MTIMKAVTLLMQGRSLVEEACLMSEGSTSVAEVMEVTEEVGEVEIGVVVVMEEVVMEEVEVMEVVEAVIEDCIAKAMRQ